MKRATIIKVALLLTATSLLVAVLVWLLFFSTSKPRLIKYVPETDTVIFEPNDAIKLEFLNSWPLASWQDNLRELTAGLAVKKIIWSWTEAESETIIIELQQPLKAEQFEILENKIDQSLLYQLPWQLFQPDKYVVVLTSDNDYLSRSSQQFIAESDWPEFGPTLAWKNAMPKSLASLVGLFDKINSPALINVTENGEMHKLIWQDQSSSVTTSTPIFFPRNFDTYLRTDKNALQIFAHLDNPLSLEVKEYLDNNLQTNFNLKLSDLEKYLGGKFTLATLDKQWFLQSDTASLLELGSQLSDYLRPKLKISQLPDGSPYRELIRNKLQPLELESGGGKVYYWGEVEENRLYYLVNGNQSILTNSLAMLESSVLEKRVLPTIFQSCLGDSQGVISDILMLSQKSGVISLKDPITFIHLDKNNLQKYIFCW